MARRSRDEQAEHDRAVLLIAQQRFPQTTCHVTTNCGTEENCGLPCITCDGARRLAYPDIVAVMEPDGEIIAVGEVETAGTVTEAHSGQWRRFAQHAETCYLFVPVATIETAKSLAEGIENLQLRAYSFDRRGNIIVTRVA
jgi:hypothetical protein